MILRKTLPLLALAGLTGGAHAQSSATIYGILDVGMEYINHVPTAAKTSTSVLREMSGNLAGSRWGIKGVEDLGGGLKAIFALENGFNLNSGTLGQGGRMFGRKAFVGLSSNQWGTLTLGRQQNLLYELMYKYDALTFNPSYSAQSMDSQFVNRADNAVRYGFTAGGLTGAVMYSTGFDATIANGANVPGATKVGREMSAAALYDRGPASIGVTFDQIQGTSIATQSVTQNRTLVGGLYDFGPVRAYAAVRWLNVRNAAVPASSTLYWGGLTYKVTAPLSLTAAVYHTQFRNPSGGPTMVALLTDYALSKRTELFAEAAYVKNRAFSNVGLRGVGVDIAQGVDQSGVTAGIRHTF